MANVGITITSRSAARVAPEAVIFEVDLSSLSGFTASAARDGEVYDARYHEIEYFWDFYYSRADSSYLFSAPVNIYDGSDAWPNGYRNSRYALGFQAAHVYRAPGIYTVRLTAHEPQSGTTAYATQSVSIGDPETLFSGINTIYLSPSGDFREAPAGARRVASGDVGSAYSNFVAGQESTPKRIMLNRGEPFTNFSITMGRSADTPTCHIVAGPGSKPKPVVHSFSGTAILWDDKKTAGGVSKDLVVQNVIINGTQDSTTDPNPENGTCNFYNANTPAFGANPPQSALFDGIEIYDFVSAAEDPEGVQLVFNDCVVEGFSYGSAIYNLNIIAVLGSRIMSRVDALVDATNNQGWGLRLGGLDSVVWACDMFIRQDWFGNEPHNGQPCIRFNANQNEGVRINCHASCFEAMYDQIECTFSGSPTDKAINGIFRNNFLIGAYRTRQAFRMSSAGVTIANNIFVAPPLANEKNGRDGIDLVAMVWYTAINDPINLASPIRFYQNTMVNLASSAGEFEPEGMNMRYVSAEAFGDLTIENNVQHQPNLDNPVTTYAPLGDDANTYFTPRYIGYLSSTIDDTADTATVTTAGVTDIYDPESGSSAIGAASAGLISWRDWRGVVRPDVLRSLVRSYQSAGAIEPRLEA